MNLRLRGWGVVLYAATVVALAIPASAAAHAYLVRTVASENKGIEELSETVAKFRKHFESSGQRQRKHVEHWKNRLIELLESRLLERALGGAGGEARLAELAAEVALGPVLDFDFDAAILFSDLLFPLEALGMGLEYTDSGPQLGWKLNPETLSQLLDSVRREQFGAVQQA